MRDVIQYVNSPDVREHLRRIRFQPDVLTAARIVYAAAALSLTEKHEIYRELAAEDASFDPGPLISWEQQALANFMKPREGMAYEADNRTFFGRFRTAQEALMRGEGNPHGCFTVSRVPVFDDSADDILTMRVSNAGVIFRIQTNKAPAEVRKMRNRLGILYPISVPFQQGDAVRLCGYENSVEPYGITLLLVEPIDEEGMAHCVYRCEGFGAEIITLDATWLRYAKADEPLPSALAYAARYLRGELNAAEFFTAYPLLAQYEEFTESIPQAILQEANGDLLPAAACDVSIDAP